MATKTQTSTLYSILVTTVNSKKETSVNLSPNSYLSEEDALAGIAKLVSHEVEFIMTTESSTNIAILQKDDEKIIRLPSGYSKTFKIQETKLNATVK